MIEETVLPYTIDFEPVGRRGPSPEGAILLDAARSLGVDPTIICGGSGASAASCGHFARITRCQDSERP